MTKTVAAMTAATVTMARDSSTVRQRHRLATRAYSDGRRTTRACVETARKLGEVERDVERRRHWQQQMEAKTRKAHTKVQGDGNMMATSEDGRQTEKISAMNTREASSDKDEVSAVQRRPKAAAQAAAAMVSALPLVLMTALGETCQRRQ